MYFVFKVGLGLNIISLYILLSKTDPMCSRSLIPKLSFKETMTLLTLIMQKFLENKLSKVVGSMIQDTYS